MEQAEAIIFITGKCNQNCLFCSAGGLRKTQTAARIKQAIGSGTRTVSIEGGEPTLSQDLAKWVKYARSRGAEEVIVCSNGVRFNDAGYVSSLTDAGVSLFNVNLPSHIERLFDLITQTEGQFQKRLDGLRTLVKTAGGRKIRLTFVITALNYRTMREFAAYIHKNFPEIFYVEFNLVKVLGHTANRAFLVPKLSEMAPYLRDLLKYCKTAGMKIITDGIPLCYLEGFEHLAIDPFKLMTGRNSFLGEKLKPSKCKGCSLGRICAGPRKDYLGLYGPAELARSSKAVRGIAAKIRRQFPQNDLC
ncbi:MAG: radical SAM protein [Elusimicrobiales bacterium]